MSIEYAMRVELASDLVLGVETSCDETSAAVVQSEHTVLSNIIASQIPVHQLYGGVVPEIASRQHLEQVNLVIEQALNQAGVTLRDLGGVAVTCGPGLVGALLVGVSAAKGLAYAAGLPFVGVNHLEGHLMANLLLGEEVEPPALALIVSGGHTELILWHPGDRFQHLGGSRDDAAGEALDKFARVLGLGYPGGPAIEQVARDGDQSAFKLPPAAFEGQLDFSFSGLKTAAINLTHKAHQRGETLNVADAAASYQTAIIRTLVEKTEQALRETSVERLFLAGGVAANSVLRREIQELADRYCVRLYVPEIALCTDNAAMIAAAGYRKLRRGLRATLSLNAYPGLKLGEKIVDEEQLYEQ